MHSSTRRAVFAGATRPLPRHVLLSSGLTRAQLRSRAWQRVSQGFYVPAGVDLARDVQRIASAAVRLPAGGAVGGWAAARALGVELCDGLGRDGRTPLPVPLITGTDDIRRVTGIQVWADPLPAEEITLVDGIPVSAAARTCFDGMRRAENLVEAVVFADLMLHAELTDVLEMRAYVDAHPRWRGVPQARRALDLADPAARNSWETRLRMVYVLDARLPRPLCNPPLFDLHGNLLGFPDLLDVEAGTVGEYDGGEHRRLTLHASDNVREEIFEDHGLVVTRATRLDYGDRRGLATRMQRARARGLARDRSRDRWTLEPPPDWGAMCPESDLHEALDEMDATWVPPW